MGILYGNFRYMAPMQGLSLSTGDSTRIQPFYWRTVYHIEVGYDIVMCVCVRAFVCVCKCVYMCIQCMCECVCVSGQISICVFLKTRQPVACGVKVLLLSFTCSVNVFL